MKKEKGLHLIMAENEMLFDLYDGENKIASIFDTSVFFTSTKDIPSNIKELNKAVWLINKASKRTIEILAKMDNGLIREKPTEREKTAN